MNQTTKSMVRVQKLQQRMEHLKVMFTVQNNLQKVWKRRRKQYPVCKKKS